ncbi:hypothetical protein [Oceaniglobus roseus]|uniref:hypothetical protein n=1 Tax=Oceaniglobus roseus TaxID=1737570 RepID=UPI000C7F0299|nr:hypothetical protein [Kandeliimicrobium roseum]
MLPSPLRRVLALACLLILAACANTDPNGKLIPLGDFRLGYDYVRATEVQKGPFSRDATGEELSAALDQAIEARLGRYDGDGLYHFGITIGGYVLAQPGLPVVYTPKSVMIFDITVYDNATQKKLNDEPYRITAFEGLQNTAPIIGSGLARGKEEQLKNLAQEGARQIQEWLAKHPEWFEPDPETPRTPFDRAKEKAKLAKIATDKARALAAAKATGSVPATVATGATGGAGGSVAPLAAPSN